MRLLKWLFVVLILLVIAGASYQFAGMMLDRKHYPPPGRLIDVDGHRLHILCTGEGSPTVVLEAAAPGWSLYWSLVQPEVARVTRVCAYDRAGFGWSEPGPLPRTGARMARELHTLLDRAGISGPYVLAGHSLGGFIVRLYREQHPDEVVGMLLVDAGHEMELHQPEFRAFVKAGKQALPVIRAMTVLGILRLFASFDMLPPFLVEQEEKVPEKIRPMFRAGWLRTSYSAALAEEAGVLDETLTQVKRSPSLGNLPLVVLTATGPVWWPDMPGDVNPDKFRRMWLELQQDLTKLSSQSRQMFADQSTHFIQFDQPDLVIDAIRQIIDITRRTSAIQ
jgi:pimeloyl-ACP methyl ester carboxylesterase